MQQDQQLNNPLDNRALASDSQCIIEWCMFMMQVTEWILGDKKALLSIPTLLHTSILHPYGESTDLDS